MSLTKYFSSTINWHLPFYHHLQCKRLLAERAGGNSDKKKLKKIAEERERERERRGEREIETGKEREREREREKEREREI
jgi:hypothetical protein